MNRDNNITNINEYRTNMMPDAPVVKIDQTHRMEFLSQSMTDDYERAIEAATPNLWDRIETGFDQEWEQIKREKRIAAKKRNRLIGVVAAALLITIIAIPVMGNFNENIKSSIDDKSDKPMYDYVDEQVKEDISFDAESNSPAMDDSFSEEAESPSVDNVDQDINSITHDSDSKELTDEFVCEAEITILGYFDKVDMEECVFVVEEVVDSEYTDIVLAQGDKVYITNPIDVCSYNRNFGPQEILEADSLYVDEEGKYCLRMKAIKIP
ncbi:MAG: hypothetical protein E7258_08580 [Lachnospiraceae bacterium]|nr:hypothetical protein [Lachnospiraceae bacterium]